MHKHTITSLVLSVFALAPACRMGGGGAAQASAFDTGAQRSEPSTTVPASSAAPSTGPAPSTTSGAAAPAPAPATSASPTSPTAPTANGAARKLVVDKAELGEPAPDFRLTDVNGRAHRLSQYKGKHVVLEWINPKCTFCIELHKPGGVLREMPQHWMSAGVVWIAINSQGPSEAGSSLEENKKFARDHALRAPLLLDPSGAVGRAYGARTTPHMFVISDKGLLVYRGALDNAPNGLVPPKEVKTNYVDEALRDMRAGRAVTITEARAYGSPVQYAKP